MARPARVVGGDRHGARGARIQAGRGDRHGVGFIDRIGDRQGAVAIALDQPEIGRRKGCKRSTSIWSSPVAMPSDRKASVPALGALKRRGERLDGAACGRRAAVAARQRQAGCGRSRRMAGTALCVAIGGEDDRDRKVRGFPASPISASAVSTRRSQSVAVAQLLSISKHQRAIGGQRVGARIEAPDRQCARMTAAAISMRSSVSHQGLFDGRFLALQHGGEDPQRRKDFRLTGLGGVMRKQPPDRRQRNEGGQHQRVGEDEAEGRS